MKKTFTKLSLWATALLMMGSCAKSEMASEPTKVADYLYEITCTNYCDTLPNAIALNMGTDFGCSAVRSGNYYGRNLDYFITEVPELVVHTPAAEGRHASVGVCRYEVLTEDMIQQGLSAEQLYLLPWSMMDGINDAGLVCNVNVTPMQDSGNRKPTNPGKPIIASSIVIRALLDNCATTEEAIKYLDDHSVVPFDKGGFDLHFMVADPNRTVVIEFVGDSMVVSNDSIMTNFLVCSKPDLTPHADGVERYQILQDNIGEATSMLGMWQLLKRVRYSLAYDLDNTPFWASEYTDNGFTINTPVDSIKNSENVKRGAALYKTFLQTGKYKLEDALWHTTHNSTYDIKNRKLWVTVHEDYDHRYEFSLE